MGKSCLQETPQRVMIKGTKCQGLQKDQKYPGHNQKVPISLAPPRQAAEGSWPLRMCGGTGAPLARRAVPGGTVFPLRNPL